MGEVKIHTLMDFENKLLRERAAEASRAFESAIRPIYSMDVIGRNPRAKPAGSCILLSVDGHRVMSNAAHVLDERAHGIEIYIAGPNGLVAIQGGMHRTTTAPNGDRSLDHMDCGFWMIPDAAVDRLGEVEFLDESRFSPNRAPIDQRYYLATGFRYSLNKKHVDNPAKQITAIRSRYSGAVSDNPGLAKALNVSGSEHLFLNFDQNAPVQNEAGDGVNAWDPRGFSGGALIDLGDFTHPSAYTRATMWTPKLSGMLIEHQANHKAMVAVRIEAILPGIQKSIRSLPKSAPDPSGQGI
jgi:hypothetical protein